MRTGIILAAIAIMSIGEVSSAHADGWFFSEGFGTSKVHGDLAEVTEGSVNFRMAVGRRMGRWALEGFVMGNMLDGKGPLLDGMHSTTGYGLSARYNLPVSKRLELYVRGGLHKMSLDLDESGSQRDGEFSGRAFHYGVGASIKGKVPVLGLLYLPLLFTDYGPKMTGALWLETNQQFTKFQNPNFNSISTNITSWTMGFSLGSDF